ncbi:MAG: glycosyltransferase [Clostridia bacterium]|nr:glycosyltransferase [Clostridia bacterium]
MSISKVYITALHLNHGGVEMVIASIANAFVEKGLEVEVLTTYRYDKPAYDFDERVKITYLTDVRPNREEFSAAVRSKNPFRILKEGLKAVKVLRLRKSTMVKAIKAIEDGAVISTRHDHNMWLSQYGNKNVLKIAQLHFDHKFDPQLVADFKANYSNIDYFTLLTDKVTGELKEIMDGHNSHTKCVTLPNFLNFEPVDRTTEKKNQVIAAGRLHPDKDFATMLRIWKKVCDRVEGYVLKIAGQGELEGELKAYAKELGIEEKVCFMGGVPHGALLQEMHDSKAYLMTSVSEALPMVLLEAMYCETPPISFELRIGTGSIINDGVNGVVVPERNDDDYVEKLVSLLSLSDDEMARMRENCMARAMDFSKEKVVSMWFDLFNGVL